MKNIKYLLLSFPFLYSCGYGEWETTLYAQKIEGTSKVLYKYDASGGRDSMVSGYLILDSTEIFEVDLPKNLPFSYLVEIPNKEYILGVDFEEPDYENLDNNQKKIFTPIKNLNTGEQNIEIKTKIYQYSGFMSRNGGYDEYEFESFKETRDSLFFYNLEDVKSLKPKQLENLKFKKRNVVIMQYANKEVIAIRIEDLILSNNNELISNITYSLIPKKKLNSNQFTAYGVFKEIAKK